MKYYPAAVQTTGCKSLPSRERGLKFRDGLADVCRTDVAPFAGAWIEMESCCLTSLASGVAPFAGAWIEISCLGVTLGVGMSRRSLRGSVD